MNARDTTSEATGGPVFFLKNRSMRARSVGVGHQPHEPRQACPVQLRQLLQEVGTRHFRSIGEQPLPGLTQLTRRHWCFAEDLKCTLPAALDGCRESLRSLAQSWIRLTLLGDL